MLNTGNGGNSSDMSARGRVRLTVVMVDTALTYARGRVCLTMVMVDTAVT